MLLGWADVFLRRWVPPGSVRMLLEPKYDSKALHEAIREKLENLKLGETVTRIFVPAYDTKRQSIQFFSSCDRQGGTTSPTVSGELQIGPKSIPLVHICAGTTAAPTYFPAHSFKSNVYVDGKEEVIDYNLVDGGVTTNNPTLEAIWLIKQQMEKRGDHLNQDFHSNPNEPGSFDFKKCFVLSVGTGAATQQYERPRWGIIGWLRKDGHSPLLDIFSRASTGSVHWNTWFLFRLHEVDKTNYLRINPRVRTYILVAIAHPEAQLFDSFSYFLLDLTFFIVIYY